MATNSIRYIYNSNMGMELIFCENSTISYPTHNHVSVLTIGIVLDGSIVLVANNNEKVYENNLKNSKNDKQKNVHRCDGAIERLEL